MLGNLRHRPAISGRVHDAGIAWRGLDGDHTLNLSTNPFNDMGAVKDNGGG